MLETHLALRTRYGASAKTHGSYFMFTDIPVTDCEDYSLVRLDKASAAEMGRLWADDHFAWSLI